MIKRTVSTLMLCAYSLTVGSQEVINKNLMTPAIDVFPNHNKVVRGEITLDQLALDGKKLFKTKFNLADGIGRPSATGDSKPTIRNPINRLFHRISGPDSNSCFGCHNDPHSGGSGGLSANAFVGAHVTDPPTNSISSVITSERNTLSIFGSGFIEMIAYEMTEELQAIRKQALLKAELENEDVKSSLITKGINFGYIIAHSNGTYDAAGINGVDMDLVLKPFGVKGVAVSIREFTNFALNQHHGIQSEERFGWARTGIKDFDGDGIVSEFSIGQMTALTIYQASLPAPVKTDHLNKLINKSEKEGQVLFNKTGCTNCHVENLPLRSSWFFEPNPYNRPGSIVPNDVEGQIALPFTIDKNSAIHKDDMGMVYVSAYTDLKRHVICDEHDMFYCNEKVEQDFVPYDQYLTTKLWDVGSSAPYGHQGNITTIHEAIIHHAGEAQDSKEEYLNLTNPQKIAIINFLKSLKVSEVARNIKEINK